MSLIRLSNVKWVMVSPSFYEYLVKKDRVFKAQRLPGLADNEFKIILDI
jgi:hypothetical protein